MFFIPLLLFVHFLIKIQFLFRKNTDNNKNNSFKQSYLQMYDSNFIEAAHSIICSQSQVSINSTLYRLENRSHKFLYTNKKIKNKLPK